MTDLQQKGPARLLDDVRAEARSKAESMVWSFEDDQMFLEIEWVEHGVYRFDKHLSSSEDMRNVHLVESFALEAQKSA